MLHSDVRLLMQSHDTWYWSAAYEYGHGLVRPARVGVRRTPPPPLPPLPPTSWSAVLCCSPLENPSCLSSESILELKISTRALVLSTDDAICNAASITL